MGYKKLSAEIGYKLRIIKGMDAAADQLYHRWLKLRDIEWASMFKAMKDFGVDQGVVANEVDKMQEFTAEFAQYYAKMSAALDCMESQLSTAQGHVDATKHDRERAGLPVAP